MPHKTTIPNKAPNQEMRTSSQLPLTHYTYNTFLTVPGDKTQDPLRTHEARNQMGCTVGARQEDNIFIEGEIYHVTTPTDVAKASDSTKRRELVEILSKYRTHPLIMPWLTPPRTIQQKSTTLLGLIPYSIIKETEQWKGLSYEKLTHSSDSSPT